MAISIYQLKPAFTAFLRPLAAAMAGAGISANQVTVAACLLSCLYGLLLFFFSTYFIVWLLLPLWLVLRMALNAIDGILAREHGQQSNLGAILNEMGDVLADAALLAPLAFVPGVHWAAVALFLWAALLTEFAGVLALLVGGPRRYDGPMGKSDRAFLLLLSSLLVACGLLLNRDFSFWLNLLLWAGVLLMCLTMINRLSKALSGGGKS
ncbi:CDP-alcohol phosphatidyltransferase family protein [Desulfovibrio sp. OttesenSCG-928-A18]|nr:CDP-alcohol phosphatidyltransferase family protein [Desulfovibrio sp. OttesenSCG-928-A18]